jgi:hypothetical protein
MKKVDKANLVVKNYSKKIPMTLKDEIYKELQ